MDIREDTSGPIVTVVICTYNRNELLANCLKALSVQTASSSQFDVLVVDNASTDGTAELVEEYAATTPYILRLVTETVVGLSHARNSGARASKGAWLAYLDDDVEPFPEWVKNVLAFIEKYPEPSIFGGPYVPLYLTPPPRWLPGDCGRFWQGDKVVRLPYRKYILIGCNFIVHRQAFKAVGGFDHNLGMCGNTIRYGEETMFYRRAIKLGLPVYYTPQPVVQHLVRPEKYRLTWHAESLVELGKSLARKLGPWLTFPATICLWLLTPMLMAVNFCVFLDVPFLRRVYFALHPPCYAWGMARQAWIFVRRGHYLLRSGKQG